MQSDYQTSFIHLTFINAANTIAKYKMRLKLKG